MKRLLGKNFTPPSIKTTFSGVLVKSELFELLYQVTEISTEEVKPYLKREFGEDALLVETAIDSMTNSMFSINKVRYIHFPVTYKGETYELITKVQHVSKKS